MSLSEIGVVVGAHKATISRRLAQAEAQLETARTQAAGLLSGLDVAYDLGAGHPLLGRRMPDLDLTGYVGADGAAKQTE